jgi:ferredoxin-fold anticodon binding domain-containing protein
MGQKISEKQMKEEIRSVVRQNIKEVTTNDWHYKAIMAIWDKGGSFTRKKIGTILLKDPKADRRDVEDALRNSGYDEVTDVTDRLRIEGVIKEGEDNIPGGLAKGMTLNDIAEKHGMSVDMLVAEFKKGIQTEMEHTTDRDMAKEITMDHLFEDPQYYTKLATVEEYVDDKGVEHVAAALPQTEEEPLKEATANANILGIDFNINETDGDIMFSFKDKTAGSIKVREIGSNKIVNLIQNSLDKAYGKGSYFFKSGKNAEIIGGYLFKKNESNINLNKLKFESIIKEGEDSEETLEGLKEMAMGDLERIADYANMILERMGQGQNLDSWMYSQITLAVDQLNSVHDTMDGTDGKKEEVKEGKINEGAKRFYQLDYPNSKYVIYYYDGKTYYSDGYGGKTDAYETSGFLNKSQAEKLKKELIKKGYREDDRMRKESVNEEKVYIDYLNKQKGFKQDRIKFNSYEEAVKWAKKNFEKFNSDMIKYESVNEATEPEIISQIKNIAKTHQNNIVVDPKSGKKMRVDAFSASAIATVYDALSNSNKEKFLASGLLGMQQMAMKLLKK